VNSITTIATVGKKFLPEVKRRTDRITKLTCSDFSILFQGELKTMNMKVVMIIEAIPAVPI
jgi:hypothetical protein